jgi:multidrug resistance efflux pump
MAERTDAASTDQASGPPSETTRNPAESPATPPAEPTEPTEPPDRDEPADAADQPGRPGAVSAEPEAAGGGDRPAARRRRNLRKWWARLLVLLMIAVAVFVGLRIVRSQDARDAALDLGTVTLTSQSIPVETSLPGLVTAVDVRAGQRVVRGQRLGQIVVTTTDAQGDTVEQSRALVSPRAGYVVDDPMTVGSTLQPATPFVELYDPADLRLEADVPLAYLAQITPGMRAELSADGLDGEIEAVVQRAVPRVGEQVTTGPNAVRAGRLRLVLVPIDRGQVSKLIPGLRFTGSVDTRTGPKNGRESVYVG